MTIKVHDLKPASGSTKAKRRVGRGIAGKGGKTAGRGTKGQNSRGRGKVARGFEGGQTPLHRRTPKLKGFNNPFRVEYQAINLDTLTEIFDADATVTLQELRERGLAHKHGLVKVLGRGSLDKKLSVQAHAFSASARQAIEAAGGRVEVVPSPWGDRRPPARGNQHANR
jgi:large subunit ribosomal protein L15